MASIIFAVNRGGSRPAIYPGCFINGLMSNPGQVNRLNSETTIALPGASPAAALAVHHRRRQLRQQWDEARINCNAQSPCEAAGSSD